MDQVQEERAGNRANTDAQAEIHIRWQSAISRVGQGEMGCSQKGGPEPTVIVGFGLGAILFAERVAPLFFETLTL
jgi:hypothetical protein